MCSVTGTDTEPFFAGKAGSPSDTELADEFDCCCSSCGNEQVRVLVEKLARDEVDLRAGRNRGVMAAGANCG